MRNLIVFAITITMALVISGPHTTAQDKGKTKGDAKKLQGTWTATKEPLSVTLTFKGKSFTFTMTDGQRKMVAKGTVKTDPTTNPKCIDFNVKTVDAEDQNIEGKTSLGIYKFEGKRLVWCGNEPGNDTRPDSFDMEQPGHLLLSFERKEEEK